MSAPWNDGRARWTGGQPRSTTRSCGPECGSGTSQARRRARTPTKAPRTLMETPALRTGTTRRVFVAPMTTPTSLQAHSAAPAGAARLSTSSNSAQRRCPLPLRHLRHPFHRAFLLRACRRKPQASVWTAVREGVPISSEMAFATTSPGPGAHWGQTATTARFGPLLRVRHSTMPRAWKPTCPTANATMAATSSAAHTTAARRSESSAPANSR